MGRPWHALAPYPWSCGIGWCPSEVYKKRRSAPPPMDPWGLEKDFTLFSFYIMSSEVWSMVRVSECRHVFLGFTRDGQFVLSYTVQVDVDNAVSAASNCYTLYCWLFIPYKPLRLVVHCSHTNDQWLTSPSTGLYITSKEYSALSLSTSVAHDSSQSIAEFMFRLTL